MLLAGEPSPQSIQPVLGDQSHPAQENSPKWKPFCASGRKSIQPVLADQAYLPVILMVDSARTPATRAAVASKEIKIFMMGVGMVVQRPCPFMACCTCR